MPFFKKKNKIANLLNLSGGKSDADSADDVPVTEDSEVTAVNKSSSEIPEEFSSDASPEIEDSPFNESATSGIHEGMDAGGISEEMVSENIQEEGKPLQARTVRVNGTQNGQGGDGGRGFRPQIRINPSEQSKKEKAQDSVTQESTEVQEGLVSPFTAPRTTRLDESELAEIVSSAEVSIEEVPAPVDPSADTEQFASPFESKISDEDSIPATEDEAVVFVSPFESKVTEEEALDGGDDSVVFVSPFDSNPSAEGSSEPEDQEYVFVSPFANASPDTSIDEADDQSSGVKASTNPFDEAIDLETSNESSEDSVVEGDEGTYSEVTAESPTVVDTEGVPGLGFVIVKKDPSLDSADEIASDSTGIESGESADESNSPESSDDTSITVRSTLQKKYTPDELREFAQYLPKMASSRYEAVILNSWTTGFNTRQFEVGLVHLKNGDHRNGVLRTLKVSPLDVKFVPIDEEVFVYLHESIYDPKAEVEAIIQEQKKQSQKTKAWGEGQSTLSPEEAFALQAAEVEFDIGSEEWMDLTNIEEYERNIKRNEAELTTQEFIRLILMEFLRSGSSDMHIESGQPTGRIRFRYDSEMFIRWDDIPFVKIKQIAAGLAETAGKDATRMKFKDIDSTIKVKALRDGVPADVELRFASQPTLYSPSIVLRSQLKPIRDINVVGFLPSQVEDLETAYSQKRGIIVVTGATGSGKTNTLESIYAKLEETDKFKIIEIGEPIEIRSGRRTQISLRPNTPFTWWDAFYSCLRSDPDIIGIGELRSAEHLSVAINAALTGHLVLSTFHAASVEDTLTRMFQMGIPRENLATGINLILAQTLIKRLCEKCKVIDETASEQFGKTVYKAAGCPECFNKGTRGRTAMAELLYFNDEVKQWIQDKNMSARDVVQRATREGHLLPMKVVAREKVLAGLASTHETSGALGYLESSESWNNGNSLNYSENGEKSHTQEITPGDIPDVEDFIEGEIIDE